jgi:hypothetical protein
MWADAVTEALEGSKTLDRVGRALGKAFSAVVRSGHFKDLLSGTWLASTPNAHGHDSGGLDELLPA